MKTTVIVLAALLAASCSKDEERVDVRLRVECRTCAVEYEYNGETKRDTIYWTINYGATPYDTVPGSGTYNLASFAGGELRVTACDFDSDTMDTHIRIKATTYSGNAYNEAFESGCATLNCLPK